jgi:rSAM/selenodomain-associated transferase 1
MKPHALIIIAKYPENGEVKTRIQGLNDSQRVALYTKLLEHTMRRLSSLPEIDTFIAYAPEDAGDYFSRFDVKLIALSKGDLGERMYEAFQNVFALGYRKASLVGADIPDLTGSIIQQSFHILTDHDLVFGPAQDGGYYLVGMSSLIQEVFIDVPWSSDKTLEKSLQQAKHYGYSAGLLETLYDIDTLEDVKKAGLLP